MSMSATSVVVTSMTAEMAPESTNFSIERPPAPVAWKTRHSQSAANAAVICCTQGVVTPNIVSPTDGTARRRDLDAPASRLASRRAFTIPIKAWAPLASTCREIELRPWTSVTEYIIVMSVGPT